ncbi:MAG: EAL domain-containing protein [Pseudoxanthomonas suwonensis]|nr:EAL domain-containing protein [Pseudoxanthomonas suwonensis]
MPPNKSQALRLMIVDDSVEAAEAIVSTLRNDGIAVRPLRPGNTEELDQLLDSQPMDLVLAALPGKGIATDQLMQRVSARGRDLPVLALVDAIDGNLLQQVHAAGMRGCALRDAPQQLLGVIRNEWNDLETRRGLRRLEAQVRETERRCDALIESSRDPIAYVHEGMHIRANVAYLEMFGFETEEDIEGMSLLDLVAPDHVEEFRQLLKRLGKGEAPPPQYELEARTLGGERFPATMEFIPAMYEGEPCQQVVLRRQEVDPGLMRELEELRQRDPTTGLLNRTAFLHALEQAVAGVANDGQSHGLLLIEPDHYQRLLQNIGLESADAALSALAGRLRSSVGGNAVLARFSDHTLAALLPDSDHLQTSDTAERIREQMASHVFEIGNHSASITASVGGVQIGEKIASVNPVLAKAVEHVQRAVGSGGNRVELFDAGAVDRAEAERIDAWVRRLREALAGDHFRLHYQPIVSLQGNPVHHYECLLRLDGGEQGLIAPEQFLGIAEEHDLLADIDRWVIEAAVKAAAERLRQQRPVTLLVKLSQPSLLQPEASAAHLEQSLERHALPAEHIILEASESRVFPNLRATQALITTIAGFGGRVCLEQFGAGLDSFQLLSHLEQSLPALLKIDRSFIEELAGNADSQARVAEIVQRAGELGIGTIAEFVSDAASMATLFSTGVDFVQGAFLAMPGPSMDYEFE